ncbi:hypothetical protein [Devosia sp. MC1541]|uniref:hypothetical protein n=1 Tax=Devosia sp. MC1541 TaxID=2725264 RepID=UPI00145EAE19|nr:hypothetical protein [Devosia sp. MC1541]
MSYISSAFAPQPQVDRDRRIALGLDAKSFARRAGITTGELHEYELTQESQSFDSEVAARIGEMLSALEARSPV